MDSPYDQHKLFPIGLHCCHCDQWLKIDQVALHVKLQHYACAHCQADRELAGQLVEDFRTAAAAAFAEG